MTRRELIANAGKIGLGSLALLLFGRKAKASPNRFKRINERSYKAAFEKCLRDRISLSDIPMGGGFLVPKEYEAALLAKRPKSLTTWPTEEIMVKFMRTL